jgi:hypothetical protein
MHSAGREPRRGGHEIRRKYGPNIEEPKGLRYVSEK